MTPISTQINPALFQTADLSKVYISPSFEENLQTLLKGIREEKKIFLISGKQGSGKKTLVKKAIYEIKGKALLVDIKQENIDYEKIIETTGKCLEKNFSSGSPLEEKLARINELLKKKSIQHVAVLFDQTVEFKRTVLENGLLLINSSLSKSCLFHLIITGQSDLSNQIKNSGFPASILQNSGSIQIDSLSFNEIRSYINCHLKHLDNHGDNIFSEEAINQIIKYSKGLPGLINRLCSLGLLTANLEEKSSVSLEMINEVLENSLFLGNEFDYTPPAEDNSFSVDKISDNNVTFNNTISPNPTPSEPQEHTNPIDQAKQPVDRISTNIEKTAVVGENPVKPKKLDPEFEELIKKNEAIVSRENKSNDIDLDNLINSIRTEKKPVRVEQKPLKTKQKSVRIEQKPVKIERQDIRVGKEKAVKYKSKKRYLSPNKRHVSSKSSPIFSAFSMGVIFSTLIATGLYFFLFKNQGTPISRDTASDLLTSKNEYPQEQLEARLNYLEQQLKNRQSNSSEKNTTVVNKKNTIDYVSELPATAAGTNKITQNDTQNTAKDINLQNIKKGEIQELLSVAEQQLDDKNLMTPVSNSAWTTYNKILTIEPNNQEANSGINKIRDTYILWARHEIKKGNPKHATFLFKKALEISPGDAEILSAIITLEGKKPTDTKTIKKSKVNKLTKSNDAFSKNNLFRLLDTPKGIEKLIAIAELQISRKNLTSPERNSAFTIYKIILKRFPRHTSALNGLKIIKETYVDWAKLEIAQGNYQLAESFYSKALEVAPADPEIVSNLDQLRETINQ